jgi:hypothetical protein
VTHAEYHRQLRDSEKLRIDAARESSRNTIKLRPSGFAECTDKGNRAVALDLDIHALLVLRAEVEAAIAKAQQSDDVAPETLRPPRPEYVDQAAPTVPCIPCDWDE